jgi:hypothetical protein
MMIDKPPKEGSSPGAPSASTLFDQLAELQGRARHAWRWDRFCWRGGVPAQQEAAEGRNRAVTDDERRLLEVRTDSARSICSMATLNAAGLICEAVDHEDA